MYGPLIIAYLFLGGTAAGGFFAMASWSLLFARTNRRHDALYPRKPILASRRLQSFEVLQRCVYALCLVLLVMAVVFLFWDLGSPENVLLVFIRPRATVITFGAVCLAVEMALGLLLVCTTTLHIHRLQGRVKKALEFAVCVFSFATMSYTGVFLFSSIGIAFWNTWTIIGLFVFSSFSCGLALMLLVVYFIQDQIVLFQAARPLQKWHLICLAGESLFLGFFLFSVFNNPDAASALEIMLSPDVLSTGSIGIILFGILIPAVSEIYALAKQGHRTIPASDAICLTGGLILRWCIIVCGVH